MKHTAKRFAALLAALVLALCLSIPAFAAAPLVRDEMGLFDADTYSQLEASAEAASDGHDCDVYFLVVDSIGDADQRDYAKNYYISNGLGSGSEQSGILFLLAVGSRKYVTITYGGGVTAFTDTASSRLKMPLFPISRTTTGPRPPPSTSPCAPTRWISTPSTANRWMLTTIPAAGPSCSSSSSAFP